ncbi:MAG TPA: hypothetical protein VHH11_03000 [Gammaproteobacteria bacterium]|nr:hypothetical protein [Gammaproteobacteria bacterium]
MTKRVLILGASSGIGLAAARQALDRFARARASGADEDRRRSPASTP